MVRIPRPVPKITPNTLLDTPPMSRRSSVSSFGSVSSTTRLIREDSMYSQYTAAPNKRRGASYRSYNSSAPSIPVHRGPSQIHTGSPYDPMQAGISPPIRPHIPRSVSVTPPTPNTIPTSEVLSRPSSRATVTTRPLPNTPMFTNPFLDPISRHNTPQTAWSQMSFSDSTASAPVHTRGNSNLDQWPPLLPVATSGPVFARARETTFANMIPVWSPYEHRWVHSHSSQPERPFSARPNMVITGTTLRNHTATPHSIHSVTGSISHYVPESLLPSHPPTTPNPIHARASSESGPVPLYRPATVAPHMATTYTGTSNSDGPLPNPFPRVAAGRTEVRRFGSVPSAQFYTGQGGTYLSANATTTAPGGLRNAAHLAGALGRTPPRSEAATAADPEQWKALVFSAATGRMV